VIATLKHLVDTGDRILKVEGIFSGTLSYIFNMFSQDKPFSDIVTEAKALGYTEPDPRDDLAGMDVARKVTILARYNFTLLTPLQWRLRKRNHSVLCHSLPHTLQHSVHSVQEAHLGLRCAS